MTTGVIDVSFNLIGSIQIDIDRAMEDPWWNTYTNGYDLNDPIQLQQAIYAYVSAYLRQEDLLANVPWSTGPATIYSITIEVKNGGRNNAEAERADSTS